MTFDENKVKEGLDDLNARISNSVHSFESASRDMQGLMAIGNQDPAAWYGVIKKVRRTLHEFDRELAKVEGMLSFAGDRR